MQAGIKLKEHLLETIGLSDEALDYIIRHFKPFYFEKGAIINHPGDEVMYEYFVVDGCVKSFFINDEGEAFIIQLAMDRERISDYASLYFQEKSRIGINCAKDTHVLCISHDDREKLCREFHQMEHFFRSQADKGYAAGQRRLLSVLNSDGGQEYRELICRYPDLHQLVSATLIASYLGVSPVALTRLSNTM